MEENDSKHIPKTIKVLRGKCRNENENEIVEGRITKNYLFNSPSYAAVFVLGVNTNGKMYWKTKDGISLKDLEERQI
ncbi:DUF4357 domain-containing protein [Pseudoramibacter alactolyticus]|uniref:DUF4357 domain-containing protein n=1 Tax=Pseudoramibacter alactolyticus TaxID=113287 RepID=UPI0028D36728|nr:DUF4357 domain-containing protein [Pseudoramibacter alactolyticus]